MHSGYELSIVYKGTSKPQNQPFVRVPNDILFIILQKLEWIDRIRVRRVCKNWLHQMTKIPYEGEFPWLYRHKISDSVVGCKFKLTDKSSKSYAIESGGRNLYGASICTSKFGWILMTREQKRQRMTSSNHNTIFKFFVYCPFICKLINLPFFYAPFFYARVGTTRHYTFSSNPTSPDCVFFALFANSQRMEIRTCRTRDKGWKNVKINLSIPYVRFCVESMNGLLYIVLLRANAHNVEADPVLSSHMGTFDPEIQEWKLINNEKGFLKSNGKNVKLPRWEHNLCPVVHNNKEFFLIRKIGGVWDIFKFNMEEKQWVEQPSLGNRVLFVGSSSFLVEAVGELSNLANHAFVSSGCGSPRYPYSFSSRKFKYHRDFYVADRKFEHPERYTSDWIIPSV